MLPKHYHLILATLPPKHTTHVLAVIIHTVLHKHVFNSKESLNTICEEFQAMQKKLYKGLLGKCYNAGVKLSKAEKVQKESEAKVKKLTQMGTQEDQDADKAHAEMDTSDMPELLSDEDEPPKKFTFKKPTTRKPQL